MNRKLLLFITALSLLFSACGSAASGSRDDSAPSGTSSVSVSSGSSSVSAADISESDASDDESNPSSAVPENNISEIDEGLRVVLAQIRDTVHPGEAGASLKSAQAAADALDFALGTELDAETIKIMTQTYHESLHETAADAFPEQLQAVDEIISELQSEEGESLLEDAGITDSSYPWTDEAFARVSAMIHSIK